MLLLARDAFSQCLVEILPPRGRPPRWYAPWRTFLSARVRLLQALVYRDPEGHEHCVPMGTLSDGSSVPMFLAPFAPDRLETLPEGILHDWLCGCGYRLSYCDAIYRQALIDRGVVSGLYAYLYYLGLRLASPWRRRSKPKPKKGP